MKKDILSNVPVEVAQNCMLYLDSNSILKLRSTSKSWGRILNSDFFWKQKCKIDNISDIESYNETDSFKNFVEISNISLYYEQVWVYKTLLVRNWLMKPVSQIKKAGFAPQFEIVYVDENVTVTNGLGKYKVYNVKSKVIDIFSETAQCNIYHHEIFRRGDILIIRNGHCIIVRNVKTRSYLWRRNFITVNIDRSPALAVDDNLIAATVKHNKLISLVDLCSGNIKFNIRSTHSVSFIRFGCNKKLFSISNGVCSVYDLRNRSLIYTHILFNKNYDIFNLQMDNSYLFTISKKIKPYRTHRTYHAVHVQDLNEKCTVYKFPARGFIILKNSKFIYRKSFTCMKIMIYDNGDHIIREIETKYEILTLVANNHFIMISCDNGIAIYDIWTGEEKRFISSQELFGIEVLENGADFYVSNTKIIVYLRHNNVMYSCILDFDINVDSGIYPVSL